MAIKRFVPAEESDQLLIRPLGAGQEVGRSCIILELKGRKIMLDCGIHPGLEGMDALPYIDLIDPAEIDLLLISHFHLDHWSSALAIYRWLLSDYVKVSNISADDMLYTETDLDRSQAADFSRQEDRHLMAVEIPSVKPDILIIESTYGTHIHEKREEREARSELLLILGGEVKRDSLIEIVPPNSNNIVNLSTRMNYWQNHPELHDIPIYYASSWPRSAWPCTRPTSRAWITSMTSAQRGDGVSGYDAERASPESCLRAGAQTRGTESSSLDTHIMSEPEEITTMSGQKLQLKMSVDYISSFSAHTDYQQTSEFIRALKHHVTVAKVCFEYPGPREQNEMARLKAALIREYEDNDQVHIEVHNPRNTEAVTLNFRGEKLAKVMGSLADEKCVQGQRVSGILVKKNFNYHILNPSDLSTYTELAMRTVKQTQAIPFTGPYSLLVCQLRSLTGEVEELDGMEKHTLKIF
ncbi:hypothetical protein KUCAC02_025746 [Chaenocephalus aceratus]|uniref:Uncharacterized protein n=1 Tax=Chaenocephalus aceratus TaxID=36190 RepID=A0ACB9VVH1_CHAAC|nr:hypothetical protein KUCAC02_025746 [Chaenocephalus aceratus]